MSRFLVAVTFSLLSIVAHAQQQVVISEVMYNPPPGKPEFIELWNIANTPLDTERWKFTAGIEFTFPNFSAGAAQAHFIKAQERILISSADDATTRAAYPSIPANVRILGPWSPAKLLENKGDTITLEDRNGVVVVTLQFEDDGHWPVAADGTGHTLALVNENRAIDDWRNWRASVNNGGSPGGADPAVPAAGMAISELHFSPVTGRVDWIELGNNGTVVAPAGALFLASATNFADKIALSGNAAAGGYLSFDVNFPTDGNGDVRLFLIDASNRVLSAVKVRRVTSRDTWQVFPAGGREWYSATSSTRDAANAPARTTDLVINEIMADPPSNQRDGEFIELYNAGAAPIDLSGWELDEAVKFTFPPGTQLAPGAHLVIAANRAYLTSAYPGLSALGDWDGTLKNGGELIRLLDQFGNLADEVDYRFGGEWPEAANGNGSSLELVNPGVDNRFGGAWADSDESQKSTFQTFTINGGTYAKGTNGSPAPVDDEMRLWAVSDSHLIVRAIVLRPTPGGANLFVNGEVTTLNNNNIDGWQSRGTHWATFHDAEGVHLVADGHGDNKVNHMEKSAPGMLQNTQYTLQFEARWVSGKPRLVAQTWDTSWGGTVLVPIPLNLGTPGAPNSRLGATVPAQISSLRHSPAVPTSSQTVTVSARVSSNTALSAVQVLHRRDNINANGVWNTTAMNDSGVGGDALAGDGIWSGQIIPSAFGYNSGGNYLAEFYVRATTAAGAVSQLPRTGAGHPGLWTTDSQVPGTDLRRMRIVISQYWLDALNQDSATGGRTKGDVGRTPDRWFNFKYPRHANRYFPCTFISNESEVYYLATVRKTGSPFTRQTDANLARGRVTMPGDQLFRGKTRLYWDNDGGTTMLHNRITRYWLYLLGVPGNQNEVCRVTRNTDGFAVRETSEAFDKEMLDRIWEDGSQGQFIELDDKFWIGDDGASLLANQDGNWGYKGLDSQGFDNPTFYHNQDIPKSREVEYDYGSFIEWTRQLQNGAITQEACERMADTQAMTALAAVRGYIGDWDNITIRRGKNGYMYQRATDHKWMLIQWDSDLAFGTTTEQVLGSFPGVGNYFNRPFVRRYLNYYLNELLTNYPATGARMQAWLTAEENTSPSYSANSGTYTSWSSGRAATIQSFIGTAFTSLFVATTPTNNSTVSTNTVNVSGVAPSSVHAVICVDHPEAVLTWTSTTAWTLSGIRLQTGVNNLTFRRLNYVGAQAGADIAYTLNKTGDTPPVMALVADPNSFNVGLGEVIMLDATGSVDPDGGALSFLWTFTPNTGVNVSYPSPGKAVASFSQAGAYTVSVQGTDSTNAIATITRDVLVSSSADAEKFNGPLLPSSFTVSGTELLDNYSLNSWYSLTSNEGRLTLQITDAASRPLNNPATFPLITRALPASADFVVQTDFEFETRFFGSFFTGLFVETLEGGLPVRYAFGIDGGNTLALRRSSAGGGYSLVPPSQPFPGANSSGVGATLRARRIGTQLQFQRRNNGVWTSLTTITLAAGSTVVRGGIFATTSAGQSLRVSFDYLHVGDAGQSADLVSNLRITEIMYHPLDGSAEFIELKNIGSTPLDLTGAYFEQDQPFDLFTFPSLTLPPGGYCFVTNDSAAFQTQYGTGLIIAGQYAGALNNAGEEIHLKDPAGNTILHFTYDDAAPWPVAADGTGRSLEIRNPATNSGSYDSAAGWVASAEVGGSPGYVSFAVDRDDDGQPDTFEVVFGSNPADPSSRGGLAQPLPAANGDIVLTWSSVAGRVYFVEYRDSLVAGNWEPLTTVNATGPTSTHTDAAPPGNERYYRVRTPAP